MHDENMPMDEVQAIKPAEKYTDKISFFGWCLSGLLKKEESEYWVSALMVHFGLLNTLKIMRKARMEGIFKNIPERKYNTAELKKYLANSESTIKKNKKNADKEIDISIYFKVIESRKCTFNLEKVNIVDKVFSKLQKRVFEDPSSINQLKSLKNDLIKGEVIDPYKYF